LDATYHGLRGLTLDCAVTNGSGPDKTGAKSEISVLIRVGWSRCGEIVRARVVGRVLRGLGGGGTMGAGCP
jgi:hypothetical protein